MYGSAGNVLFLCGQKTVYEKSAVISIFPPPLPGGKAVIVI